MIRTTELIGMADITTEVVTPQQTAYLKFKEPWKSDTTNKLLRATLGIGTKTVVWGLEVKKKSLGINAQTQVEKFSDTIIEISPGILIKDMVTIEINEPIVLTIPSVDYKFYVAAHYNYVREEDAPECKFLFVLPETYAYRESPYLYLAEIVVKNGIIDNTVIMDDTKRFLTQDKLPIYLRSNTYHSHTGEIVNAQQFKLDALNTPPLYPTSQGVPGDIRICEDAIYVCTATNTWKKINLSSTWS